MLIQAWEKQGVVGEFAPQIILITVLLFPNDYRYDMYILKQIYMYLDLFSTFHIMILYGLNEYVYLSTKHNIHARNTIDW